MTTRINLISGPRNISTALMYAFANREDTKVIDEPMYAYFLAGTGDDHPGKDEILKSQSSEWATVKSDSFFPEINKDIYFIKGMAKHYIQVELDFLLSMENVLLIRDPAQLIVSYTKVIALPQMRDIGLKREWDIFEYLQSQDQQPVVIDSNDVLADPRRMLSALCKAVGVPFSVRMLSWNAGPIAEDGVWAPHWYHNVHQSTGFTEPNNSDPQVPSHLTQLLEASYEYYYKLYNHALK